MRAPNFANAAAASSGGVHGFTSTASRTLAPALRSAHIVAHLFHGDRVTCSPVASVDSSDSTMQRSARPGPRSSSATTPRFVAAISSANSCSRQSQRSAQPRSALVARRANWRVKGPASAQKRCRPGAGDRWMYASPRRAPTASMPGCSTPGPPARS